MKNALILESFTTPTLTGAGVIKEKGFKSRQLPGENYYCQYARKCI